MAVAAPSEITSADLTLGTGSDWGAGTNADVQVELRCQNGRTTGWKLLDDPGYDDFERYQKDRYTVGLPQGCTQITGGGVKLTGSWTDDKWELASIELIDDQARAYDITANRRLPHWIEPNVTDQFVGLKAYARMATTCTVNNTSVTGTTIKGAGGATIDCPEGVNAGTTVNLGPGDKLIVTGRTGDNGRRGGVEYGTGLDGQEGENGGYGNAGTINCATGNTITVTGGSGGRGGSGGKATRSNNPGGDGAEGGNGGSANVGTIKCDKATNTVTLNGGIGGAGGSGGSPDGEGTSSSGGRGGNGGTGNEATVTSGGGNTLKIAGGSGGDGGYLSRGWGSGFASRPGNGGNGGTGNTHMIDSNCTDTLTTDGGREGRGASFGAQNGAPGQGNTGTIKRDGACGR